MSLVIDLIGQLNCHVIGCKTQKHHTPLTAILYDYSANLYFTCNSVW